MYGAGGNSGALFQADFVELYNEGDAAQNLSGWSVQGTSATGTGALGASGNVPLPALDLQPGQYFLVTGTPGSTGAALTGDAAGNLTIAAAAGKVALVSQTAALACNGPNCTAAQQAQIVDFVGYGSANFFSGTKAAPTIDATHSAIRLDPCNDHDDNAAFTAITPPAPRNSHTTLAPCANPGGGTTPPFVPLDHVALSGTPALGAGRDATIPVNSTLTLTAQAQDQVGNSITDGSVTYSWQTSASAIADVQASNGAQATIIAKASGGPVTITVTATQVATPANIIQTQTASVTVTAGTQTDNGPIVPTTTFVSEIHYDNAGTDANERMEVESPAGASLDGWKIVLYDGTPRTPYTSTPAEWPLTGLVPTVCGPRQVVVVNFPVNGIQNGSVDVNGNPIADGWALVDPSGKAVELSSYEGTFVAASGPAAGYHSTDIGVQEGSASGATQSLQRAENGVWFGPKSNSFGACNPAVPDPILLEERTSPLPVGFQDQLFVANGSTDGNGHPITSHDVTWSSSDANVVSVNPTSGMLTANATGAATIKATLAANPSVFTTTIVQTSVLPIAAGARTGHNIDLGRPTLVAGGNDVLIERREYSLSYNNSRGGPNWVSWNLDQSHTGSANRCDCFSADPLVKVAGLTAYETPDWVNGGVYSRGHMAPSADWTASDGDNATTFYLSNMLPQNQTLNAGPWGSMENALRGMLSGGKELYIVAGPIFTKNRSGAGIDGFGWLNSATHARIAIPDSMFKIAIVVPDTRDVTKIANPSEVQVIATKFPNEGVTGSYTNFTTTISEIEKSTGYNFLSLLPEPIQCKLEVRDCIPQAVISGAGINGGLEGQTLSFSGATSTDADNDALTYQWFVDDMPVGSGPTLNYLFLNDGNYKLSLRTSDPAGSFSITSMTVSIANVAPTVNSFEGAQLLQGETFTVVSSFSDPGTDKWTGTIYFGDGAVSPLTLDDKAFQTSHVYTAAGTFTATATISDGEISGSASALVVVKTPSQGVDELSNDIDDLAGPGANAMRAAVLAATKTAASLGESDLKQLHGKLDNAKALIAKTNNQAATNQLLEFIRDLQKDASDGKVSNAAISPIVVYAQRVIASVNR